MMQHIDPLITTTDRKGHVTLLEVNHPFIVGMVPILDKELEFIYRSDCSDRTCVYS